MSRWVVYIVRCSDRSLYTGITTDLKARLIRHNAGTASKYTRSRRPVRVVYTQRMKNESAARKREARIKRMSRKEKEALL